MNFVLSVVLALVIEAHPIARPDSEVLEPSVLNEVRHAIRLGELRVAASSLTNAAPAVVLTNAVRTSARDWFGTNALPKTELALRMVSLQAADGAWRMGTNEVTSAVLEILRTLDCDEAEEPSIPIEGCREL